MRYSLFSCLILSALVFVQCLAQTPVPNTKLEVKVIDPNDAIVAGAKVILITGNQIVASAETNQQGIAVFDQLPSGHYSIKVIANGFKDYEHEENVSARRSINKVEVRLTVSEVRE
ncbi:MAG TPA: carboxypeptidase-like regulatory domain-containing protein, partial [Blastocatellia bacterium]|nr:carboxypeptidase-like regulatory domain-containing protein [Blastocatellia bacterium]